MVWGCIIILCLCSFVSISPEVQTFHPDRLLEKTDWFWCVKKGFGVVWDCMTGSCLGSHNGSYLCFQWRAHCTLTSCWEGIQGDLGPYHWFMLWQHLFLSLCVSSGTHVKKGFGVVWDCVTGSCLGSHNGSYLCFQWHAHCTLTSC